jgi:hypothetical protein
VIDVRDAITQAHHEEWARVVATQAFATAVGRWTVDSL